MLISLKNSNSVNRFNKNIRQKIIEETNKSDFKKFLIINNM